MDTGRKTFSRLTADVIEGRAFWTARPPERYETALPAPDPSPETRRERERLRKRRQRARRNGRPS